MADASSVGGVAILVGVPCQGAHHGTVVPLQQLEYLVEVPHEAGRSARLGMEAQVARGQHTLAARRSLLQLLLQPCQLRGAQAAAKLDKPAEAQRRKGGHVG